MLKHASWILQSLFLALCGPSMRDVQAGRYARGNEGAVSLRRMRRYGPPSRGSMVWLRTARWTGLGRGTDLHVMSSL